MVTATQVAPLAGARIEIERRTAEIYKPGSLPSRERGLKSGININHDEPIESLPSRERGLKLLKI